MNSGSHDTGPAESATDIDARVRAAKEERLRATAGQRDLVEEIAALLFADDPVGINFASNTAEYLAEAESIVIGLADVTDEQAAVELTHQVFVWWFAADDAGPRARYESVAADIWASWQRHQSSHSG